MNIEHYRQKLLTMEDVLRARIARDVETAGEAAPDQASAGDHGLADEAKHEAFARADTDSAILREVEEALRRIEEDTYGRCVICGRPIGEPRLEAVPWTRYCLEHQEQFENSSVLQTPTL